VKLAAQEGLVPGDTLAQKLAHLQAFGYDGVELNGRELRSRLPELKAALADSPIQASTICGGFPAQFTCPEKEKRQESIDAVRDLLGCAAELGATGVIFVPRFNRDPGVPDLSPLYTVDQLQRDLLVAVIRPLAQYAADLGVCLLLEPLNRYEARFPKDLADGASICEEVGSPGLRLMADFFHMSIEEADIAASLRAAAPYLRHVHLADSNRLLPGLGHTQFREPFRVLHEIGYHGFGALECGVPAPREETLPACTRFLRAELAQARSEPSVAPVMAALSVADGLTTAS
jgi:sugar phosphate isomerase/epimerase